MVENMEALDEDDPIEPEQEGSEKYKVAQPAATETFKRRHGLVLISFLICVVGTTLFSAWYLWERAADRYVSTVVFSVHTGKIGSAIELLGGVAELSRSSSSDTNIIYKSIQSQELVRTIDEAIDLHSSWAKADPEQDPIFSYNPTGNIEELISGTGLIDREVQAFTPEDAPMIAQMVYDQSSLMINRLSAIAHGDTTRYSCEELENAVERLKETRSAVTRFRNDNQIVSPDSTLQIQTGLLSSLEMQLAEALIEADLLSPTTASNDPRAVQAERRHEVIEKRIQEERDKLGLGTSAEGSAFADLVGEYETLIVDREFSEHSYTAALADFEAALAESRRQSRYLAAHVQPTLAESAICPARITTLALIALFSFLIWSIAVLIGYWLKDRC